MTMNRIASVLTTIRDNYIRINQLTETLESESTTESIDRIIKKREQILSAIKEEQAQLDRSCSHWKNQCVKDPVLASLKGEIEQLITAALVLDSIIQERLSVRIEVIKSEVSSLAKTSKAAISYARHGI